MGCAFGTGGAGRLISGAGRLISFGRPGRFASIAAAVTRPVWKNPFDFRLEREVARRPPLAPDPYALMGLVMKVGLD